MLYPFYVAIVINNKAYGIVATLMAISYAVYTLNIFFLNYVVFYNRPDLRIKKWYYCFLYPVYSIFMIINYIVGLLSVILYYGPFFYEANKPMTKEPKEAVNFFHNRNFDPELSDSEKAVSVTENPLTSLLSSRRISTPTPTPDIEIIDSDNGRILLSPSP